MSLERSQQLHNQFISNSHNVSGNDDPSQLPHDASEASIKANTTEMLINGAQAIIEGRAQGLSDDETLKYLARLSQQGQ